MYALHPVSQREGERGDAYLSFISPLCQLSHGWLSIDGDSTGPDPGYTYTVSQISGRRAYLIIEMQSAIPQFIVHYPINDHVSIALQWVQVVEVDIEIEISNLASI